MMLAALLLAIATSQHVDEFFIVSSVDAAHARIVLKRPSETTVVISVPAGTTIRGEHGEPLQLPDLRSGDTVYAVVSPQLVASSIRRAPMTYEELRKRYLPELPPR